MACDLNKVSKSSEVTHALNVDVRTNSSDAKVMNATV